VKGQLTNRFSEILKLKFVSLVGFGNLKQYCQKFLTAVPPLLNSDLRYVDTLIMKTELTLTYLSEEFLQSNILDPLKYLIASSMGTTLLVINHSNNQCVCRAVVLCFGVGRPYPDSAQTQERLAKL
jgi:hypothetical protein